MKRINTFQRKAIKVGSKLGMQRKWIARLLRLSYSTVQRYSR